MSDSDDPAEAAPRVTVAFPAMHRPGRLHGWRQGPDGRWWARVSTQVPAGALTQLEGEDYTHVPREPQYVLDSSLPAGPNGPRMVLHTLARPCWVRAPASSPSSTPVDSAAQARALLKIDDTIACDICRPEP